MGAAAPALPICAALESTYLTDGSLPQETKRSVDGGCRPHTSAFLCAELLTCRRLATAGNEALGRWGLPTPRPRFPLRSAFVLQTARYRGQRSARQVGAAAPAALAFRYARLLSCRHSLTRATKRLAGGGCRPHAPAICCARLFVLQTARYRG